MKEETLISSLCFGPLLRTVDITVKDGPLPSKKLPYKDPRVSTWASLFSAISVLYTEWSGMISAICVTC